MRYLSIRILAALALLSATASSATAQINWNVTYSDVTNGTGTGFDHAVTGAAYRGTVTAVTNYLNTIIDGRGTVNFAWDPSVNLPGNFLARAGTQYSWFNPAPPFVVGQVFLQAAGNVSGGIAGSGELNVAYAWYLTGESGTGTPASNQFDFYSVALHEITHSMHFAATMNPDGSSAFGAGNPYSRFAQFLYRGATGNNSLLNASGVFQGTSADLISNDIYWGGTFGVAANGGTRFKIFAPSSFAGGSSLSHLDEATLGGTVMSPSLSNGEVQRTFSGREIGMLLDLGWNNFDWNNTTGNWSDGAASITGSRWTNQTIQGTNKAIRAPVGTITHNMVLSFGGANAFTSTNDVAATFLLNRMILNSTAASASTIAGTAGSKLEFGFDNGFNVTPQIEQRGTGAFNITSDLAIPNGLIVTDNGQASRGQVDLSGVISGSGGLAKAGNFTVRISGSAANTFSGVTTVQAGTLLLAKTADQAAIGGPLTISGGTARLGAANQLPDTGAVTLGGGTLSTGATTGFGDVAGAFEMTASSTIALGTGSHTLQFTGFADSSLAGILTVTGWAGGPAGSGNAGRILFSNVSGDPNATYSAWLSSVQFQGFGQGGMFISTGDPLSYELAPVPEPAAIVAVAFAAFGVGALLRRRRGRRAEVAIAP